MAPYQSNLHCLKRSFFFSSQFTTFKKNFISISCKLKQLNLSLKMLLSSPQIVERADDGAVEKVFD